MRRRLTVPSWKTCLRQADRPGRKELRPGGAAVLAVVLALGVASLFRAGPGPGAAAHTSDAALSSAASGVLPFMAGTGWSPVPQGSDANGPHGGPLPSSRSRSPVAGPIAARAADSSPEPAVVVGHGGSFGPRAPPTR